MKTSGVLRDGIWQFIGTVVGVISVFVTIFVTYNIFFLTKEIKSLQVVILANTSLIEIEPTIASDIKILYKDQPISNLTLVQVRLENNGNQAVRAEDYERPMKFIFSPDAEIVDAAIIESSPSNIDSHISIEKNSVQLSPVLLNEKDRIIIRFLLIDNTGNTEAQPFEIDARVVDINDVPIINAIEDNSSNSQDKPSTINSFIVSVIGTFGLLILFELLSRYLQSQTE